MNQDQEALTRLATDVPFFLESCISIINKQQEKVPFKLNFLQKLYWETKTSCDVILKHRKPGFSTFVCGEFLHACIFEENVNAVMCAHREEDTRILFDKIKYMQKNLEVLEVPIKDDRADVLYFPLTNSTFRFVTASGKNPGRSRDITHLHLSERAFYESEAVVTGLEEACTPKARRIIETTANGAGTPFHKFWLECKAGKRQYKPHFFAWWQNPENIYDPIILKGGMTQEEKDLMQAYSLEKKQIAWRRWKIASMTDSSMFPQEHPANDHEAFISSGRSVFDWVSLEAQRKAKAPIKWQGILRNVDGNVKLEPRLDGEFAIFKTPNKNSRYVISADVAEGVPNGAFSVGDVFDCDSWEQVAQWRGRINPVLFGDVLADIGGYYNFGLLAPEINNHGIATFARLEDLQYPNLWTRQDAHGGGEAPGFLTTQRSKIVIVNGFADALRSMDVKINSDITLDESQGFVVLLDGTYANANKEKTDSVMSASIGVYILKQVASTPRDQRTKFKEAFGLTDASFQNQNTKSGYGRRNV